MGIFNLFKKEKKDEKTLRDVKISELDSIIASFYDDSASRIIPEIEKIKSKLEAEKETLKENLTKLETAQIKNSSITDRTRQIMEGNREIYIKKINVFASQVIIPDDFRDILLFLDKFDKSLENLNEGTAKSHHVVQELLLNETNAVLRNIIKISEYIRELRRLSSELRLDALNDLRIGIENISREEKRREGIGTEIKNKEEIIENNKKEIAVLLKGIDKIRKSADFADFERLNAEKEELSLSISKIKENFVHIFSVIDNPLRKYERLFPEDKLVKKYIEKSFEALFEDNKIEIAEIIIKIRGLILEGKIELKDDKKHKVINELGKFDRALFESRLSDYRRLEEELGKTDLQIKGIKIKSRIRDMQNRIDFLESQSDSLSTHINKRIKDLNQIEREKLISELEKSFSSFGQEVKIVD